MQLVRRNFPLPVAAAAAVPIRKLNCFRARSGIILPIGHACVVRSLGIHNHDIFHLYMHRLFHGRSLKVKVGPIQGLSNDRFYFLIIILTKIW
jgi:hypothetical protein